MTRVVFDSDVILDALLGRQPHYAASLAALNAAAREDAYLSAHAVTTIYYVLSKEIGSDKSRAAVADLLTQVRVAPVTEDEIQRALLSAFRDFEDGVTHAAAVNVEAKTIVTRNLDDFYASTIPVLTPTTFIAAKAVE